MPTIPFRALTVGAAVSALLLANAAPGFAAGSATAPPALQVWVSAGR